LERLAGLTGASRRRIGTPRTNGMGHATNRPITLVGAGASNTFSPPLQGSHSPSEVLDVNEHAIPFVHSHWREKI
jgi:hypothetical protein